MVTAMLQTGLSCRVWFPDAATPLNFHLCSTCQVIGLIRLKRLAPASEVMEAGEKLKEALEGRNAANIDHLRRTEFGIDHHLRTQMVSKSDESDLQGLTLLPSLL